MVKTAKKRAAPGDEPAELVLPARRDSLPRRRCVVACIIMNGYSPVKRVTLATNRLRTKWWVSAVYVGASIRASATLATTSAKKAAEWEAAIRAGRVRIADK